MKLTLEEEAKEYATEDNGILVNRQYIILFSQRGWLHVETVMTGFTVHQKKQEN